MWNGVIWNGVMEPDRGPAGAGPRIWLESTSTDPTRPAPLAELAISVCFGLLAPIRSEKSTPPRGGTGEGFDGNATADRRS